VGIAGEFFRWLAAGAREVPSFGVVWCRLVSATKTFSSEMVRNQKYSEFSVLPWRENFLMREKTRKGAKRRGKARTYLRYATAGQEGDR